MQTQRASRLHRALKLGIALALILVGLCIYKYLVRVFEGRWVSRPLVLSILGEGVQAHHPSHGPKSKAPLLLPSPSTG
jgi:hypothetical protein